MNKAIQSAIDAAQQAYDSMAEAYKQNPTNPMHSSMTMQQGIIRDLKKQLEDLEKFPPKQVESGNSGDEAKLDTSQLLVEKQENS